MSPVYAALVHYPVRDRSGEELATAVTNLDVHDLARSALTYGLRGYFVVTPIEAQRQIVERIREHWTFGSSARRIPERTVALAITEPAESIEEACRVIEEREGSSARIVATAAKTPDGVTPVTFAQESRTLRVGTRPTLLLFGTGHGLATSVLSRCDAVIEPIEPQAAFNHLSVRAASAIVLDRLFGTRSE